MIHPRKSLTPEKLEAMLDELGLPRHTIGNCLDLLEASDALSADDRNTLHLLRVNIDALNRIVNCYAAGLM